MVHERFYTFDSIKKHITRFFVYVFVFYLNFDEVVKKLVEIVTEHLQSCELTNNITNEVVK